MMDQTNMETEPQAPAEPGGIDGIIERVQSYKANPAMVTPETLDQLLNELMDLKSYLDQEEGSEPQQGADQSAMAEMMARSGKGA